MENEIKTKLGIYLQEMCINNVAFAKKIGVTHPTLMRYIRGKTVPSVPIAMEIQKATDGKVKLKDWVK